MMGRIGVAVSGADGNRVYAIVENANGGLYSSNDAGATWALVNGGRNIRQRAFYYTHVSADPHNKDLVYVLNVGTFKSVDGGKRSEEHTSELQSLRHLVCRLLLEKKKKRKKKNK